MEIAGMSSVSIAASYVTDDLSLKVLDMSLESMSDMGSGIQKMLEMSVAPHIGGNIDISL